MTNLTITIVILAMLAAMMIVAIWRPSSIPGTIALIFFSVTGYVALAVKLSHFVALVIVAVECIFILVALIFVVKRIGSHLKMKRNEEHQRSSILEKMILQEKERLKNKRPNRIS